MTAGEANALVDAAGLVVGDGLVDRPAGAVRDAGGILEVEEEGAEPVVFVCADAVIDLQPAVGGAERRVVGADLPFPGFPALGEQAELFPSQEVVAGGDPDGGVRVGITGAVPLHGAVQGEPAAADAFGKDDDVAFVEGGIGESAGADPVAEVAGEKEVGGG